jgi:hypothetical protein
LAADGVIGLWSDPEIVKIIKDDSDKWTVEELEKRIKSELL